MANLKREEVLKLARLARLELSDEEIINLGRQISEVLQYVKQLQDIDLSSWEPTSQVTGLVNVNRSDIVKDYGITVIDLLKNAPATENGQLKVKKMLS